MIRRHLSLRRPSVQLIVATLAALWVGNSLRSPLLPDLDPHVWVAAAPVILGTFIVLRRGPVVPLLLLVAGTVLGFSRWATTLGPIDFRATDLAYLALVVWVAALRHSADEAPRFRDVGQRHLAVFLVAISVGLLPLVASRSPDAQTAVVAWMRLVQTLSLVWLVPYALRDQRQRRWLVLAIALAAALELGRAIGDMALAGDLDGRLVGRHTSNAMGLIAALLVVVALHGPLARRTGVRIVLGAIGALGLLQAESIGAIAAVGVALGVFGFRAVQDHTSMAWGSLLKPARIILLVVGVFGLVALLRPQNLPSSATFTSSSTTHRLVLGYAGLEIFLDHPLIGVGWQRSSSPEVIGTPELSDRLRDRFSDVREGFFPDQNPSNVHNAYIQVPAEAGLVGLAGLVIAGVGITRRVRHALRTTSGDDLATARFAAIGMVVIAIWWNDNPFFGAQVETVIFAALLGLVASISPSAPDAPSAGGSGAPGATLERAPIRA